MSENGTHDQNEPGVLGSLPRTRPQSPSRRRESAKAPSKPQVVSPARAAKTSAKPRATKAASATKAPSTEKAAAAKASATKTTAAKTSAAKAASAKTPPRRREPPAPKQGYEPMEEPKTGGTVHPPSGVEVVEGIATIVAELASVGLKAGGRVLKDALWPIRRS